MVLQFIPEQYQISIAHTWRVVYGEQHISREQGFYQQENSAIAQEYPELVYSVQESIENSARVSGGCILCKREFWGR